MTKIFGACFGFLNEEISFTELTYEIKSLGLLII